ncbi:Hpt domain-containing protein [Gemmatimonas sp.]|uniref:Hpt domain-containing protein n=1 Tax=Gemmatimonas sp. TaxID=1962908 RepID=UPI003DA26FA9
MSAPQALIEFFQKEAGEYLDRLDQLLADPAAPDAAAFLASARALRGSATMTRLEGLPDFASTLERIATGLRDQELRWDQRLHFAVRGALVELRQLVDKAAAWADAEQRRARTQSVALASVAAGYLSTSAPAESPTAQVVPISRFFPDDGMPAILQRNPKPAVTLAQRFRTDIAAASDGVAREAASLATSPAGPSQLALTDGVRRALLGLSDVAESYGASSIATLATKMARAPLVNSAERAGVQGFAQLLMDRELSDGHLAAQVKQTNLTWNGAPAPQVAIVSIDSLLYRGHSAVARAREVRDQLKVHWQRGSLAQPEAQSLFEELSDLLDLAVTT